MWVYGICDRPELPVLLGRGLGDAPLDVVRDGPLGAVVSRHDAVPRRPTLEVLQTHEEVVESLMDERAVLPMRFGTALEDDGAVRQVLQRGREGFLAALDHVRGRVELGVRAFGERPAPDGDAAPSGREYLLRRLRFDEAGTRLHEPLAALVVDARRGPRREPGEVLRASYLVERSDVDPVRAEVERLDASRADVAIVCTGPWPPYSFVSASPTAMAP